MHCLRVKTLLRVFEESNNDGNSLSVLKEALLNSRVASAAGRYFMFADSTSKLTLLSVSRAERGHWDEPLENVHKVTSFGPSWKIWPESLTKEIHSPAALNSTWSSHPHWVGNWERRGRTSRYSLLTYGQRNTVWYISLAINCYSEPL